MARGPGPALALDHPANTASLLRNRTSHHMGAESPAPATVSCAFRIAEADLLFLQLFCHPGSEPADHSALRDGVQYSEFHAGKHAAR